MLFVRFFSLLSMALVSSAGWYFLQPRARIFVSHRPSFCFNPQSELVAAGRGHVSLKVEASKRASTRQESAKIRNRRVRRKFNGTATKPRLSVFCSDKQLYAMLIDDQDKKTLFYGCTLQKSIREDPSACTTVEAARKVGEEIVKACKQMKISEIASYDRNGFARGQRMEAFEIAINEHGFLPR